MANRWVRIKWTILFFCFLIILSTIFISFCTQASQRDWQTQTLEWQRNLILKKGASRDKQNRFFELISDIVCRSSLIRLSGILVEGHKFSFCVLQTWRNYFCRRFLCHCRQIFHFEHIKGLSRWQKQKCCWYFAKYHLSLLTWQSVFWCCNIFLLPKNLLDIGRRT